MLIAVIWSLLLVSRSSAEILVGIDSADGALVSFDSATPGTIIGRQAVSGLPAGGVLRGIDRRPSDGQLYGVALLSGGTSCQLFAINFVTGAAVASGASFSCASNVADGDFETSGGVERFRLMFDTQNIRVDPDTGAATVQTAASFSAGDPNAGAMPNLRAVAHDGTTLYAIESGLDVLVTVSPPSLGQLTTIGAAGVNLNDASFDVSTTGTAFLASAQSGSVVLFTVNLGTGAMTSLGSIGSGSLTNLLGLTTTPAPLTPAPLTPMPPPPFVCAEPSIAPITLGCNAPNTITLDIPDGIENKAVCITFAAPVRTQTNAACEIVSTVLGGVFALLPEKANLVQQYDSCTFAVDGDGSVTELDVKQGRTTVSALVLLGAGECGVSQRLTIDDGSATRKRVPASTIVQSLILVSSIGSARADPHLVGANGVKYEFFGAADANYTLVSTPQYEVTMQLLAHGPKNHFMTRIGVLFRRQTMLITTAHFTPALVANFNRQLAEEGGHAMLSGKFKIRLELCPGHIVLVSQMHSAQRWLARLNNGHSINYLNVELIVPGCHDSFGGVLGQTYKCKFEFGMEKFAFDRSTEESFRIPTLFTPTGQFSSDAKCNA